MRSTKLLLFFRYDTGVISSAMLLLEQDFTMTSLQKGIVVGGK